MAARSNARKRALDLLYACELRGESPAKFLDQAIADGEGPANEYTSELVRGVVEHQVRIDEMLTAYARDWSLQRMPVVDRNVLRLAIWELLYASDIPDAVAISEAMNLVRELSTDDSATFVNGILGSIADNAGSAAAASRAEPGRE